MNPDALKAFLSRSVSSIVAGIQELLGQDPAPRNKELEGQIQNMYDVVKKVKKYAWSAMLEPGARLVFPRRSMRDGDASALRLQFLD